MGAPALFVLREDSGLQVRFERSGAFSAAGFAAEGIDEFRRYLEGSIALDQAIDEFESQEAGVLVDAVTRTVAWHTVMWDVGQARVEFEQIRQAYPGWTVEWAVEGMWSFADVLGTPRADLRHHQDLTPIDPFHERIDGPACVLTVREGCGVRTIGLPYYLCSAADAVRIGPEVAIGMKAEEEFEIDDVSYGICVDVDRRTVGWWSCMPEEGVFPAARALWPGWVFECMGDDFERHNRFAGRRIADFDSELRCDDSMVLARPVPCVRPKELPDFR